MANMSTSFRLGDYELKLEENEFGEEYEKKAAEELREKKENIEEAQKKLIELIKEENDLFVPLDEKYLKIFLRPCKFYPQSAMEKLRKYHKFRLNHPKYFENLVPSNEDVPFKSNLFTVFPLRTKAGERILLVEPNHKWSPKTCSILQLVRGLVLCLEAAITEQRTQVSGAHAILDMYGLGLNHVWQFTPGLAKDILDFIQECIPIRLKGVHIVNQPYLFNMLFAIFKPFINEKLRKRIHFHGTNWTAFHEFIDPSILPVQYEGTANFPTNEGEKLHEYFSCFEKDFAVKNTYGYRSKK